MKEITPELERGIKLALDALSEVMNYVEASDTDMRLLGPKETASFLNRAYSNCSRAFQVVGEELDSLDSWHEARIQRMKA